VAERSRSGHTTVTLWPAVARALARARMPGADTPSSLPTSSLIGGVGANNKALGAESRENLI
jgi:hypothetical protein